MLGARGSKLQLVLNAIFHLEASPGNVAYADYELIKRHPAVKLAIPICLGDVGPGGFRVVATVPEMFDSGTVASAPAVNSNIFSWDEQLVGI